MTTPPSYVSLSAEQAARKVTLVIVLLVGLAGFAVTQGRGLGEGAHEIVEQVGMALIAVCILGRVWCSLYIGGRKVRELIDYGPYSMVRNPLYVFSFIGAAGIGAQTGSLVVAGLCALACYIVFALLVPQEEAALIKVHGETYKAYLRSTPRFLPNPGLWWDRETVTVLPNRVMRTFADGLVFLLAIPIAEGIEYLQSIHILPVLLNLP